MGHESGKERRHMHERIKPTRVKEDGEGKFGLLPPPSVTFSLEGKQSNPPQDKINSEENNSDGLWKRFCKEKI